MTRRSIKWLLVLVLCVTVTSVGCERKAAREDASNFEQSSTDNPTGGGPPPERPPRTDDELSLGETEPQDYCHLVERGYGPRGEVAVRAEEVVDGLEVPWGILFMGDGDLLVTERAGRLRLVRDGRLVNAPVATVEVAANGEGGLLGIQAHPDFDSNHRFYLYYTADKGDATVNRVEMWQLSQDGEALSARPKKVIVDDIPAARFHNGGRMRLGPDDMLYIGTGDARNPDYAQDLEVLAGKVLRVTPGGDIPPDNPYGDSPVYLIGVRNTQGFDWRDTSTMLVSDHGPSGEMGRTGHDEINVAAPGENLGWPTIYGCQDEPKMSPPSLTWDTAVPPGGAAIYTGDAIVEWKGSLMVGTLGSRHLHRVAFDGDSRRVERHETYFVGDPPEGYGRLREVIMGPDGHLYVTTSNCDGRGSCPPDGDKILRILPD
jgi:glucose/arabinose dehydrogenase